MRQTVASRLFAALLLAVLVRNAPGQEPESIAPLHRTVELNVGESAGVELSDKSKATIKLIGVEEVRDSVRQALREARVTVEINGITATILSANYRLPQPVGGVQVDCTATNGLNKDSGSAESWGSFGSLEMTFCRLPLMS